MPSLLRINGQEVTSVPATPNVEGPRPTGGVPATDKPVPGPAGTSAQMEHMFDEANDASIRGENASAMLQGKKPGSKRSLKKSKRQEDREQRRVDGVFPDGDPHNKQERAFQQAAEFEEEVKEMDLSFSRKAGQVEVSSQVFQADIDNGNGALVMGESTREIPSMFDDEENTAVTTPAPNITVSFQREDTVPNVPTAVDSETALRRALGLKKK